MAVLGGWAVSYERGAPVLHPETDRTVEYDLFIESQLVSHNQL